MQLLPSEPGAFIAAQNALLKGGGQIDHILVGTAAGDHRARIGQQLPQQRDRARRRRRHHLGMMP